MDDWIYRNTCSDCGDSYETEAWEPSRCPFCELEEVKKELAKCREAVLNKGLAAAREFGAEAEVRRLSILDYQHDIAAYFGYEEWQQMKTNEQFAAAKEFSKGREDERESNKS